MQGDQRLRFEGEARRDADVSASEPGCNAADLAEPHRVLDLSDVNAFVSAFVGGDPLADVSGDGLLDLTDIGLFVNAFGAE